MSTIHLDRIEKLREAMEKSGIDAYMIPTADYHNSEYAADYFHAREYFSGFTGSAGTLVVRREEACLWTDGRYFIQAAVWTKRWKREAFWALTEGVCLAGKEKRLRK